MRDRQQQLQEPLLGSQDYYSTPYGQKLHIFKDCSTFPKERSADELCTWRICKVCRARHAVRAAQEHGE
eukprot:14720822-Alexandrium_andersonii.AAC.1